MRHPVNEINIHQLTRNVERDYLFVRDVCAYLFFILFTFADRSHVYVTYRDQDREQQAPSGKSWEWKKCTSRDVADKIGLEMCGEFTTPKCGSGSVGASVARVYINKLDTYKGLHFDASYLQSTVNKTNDLRMLINDKS